MYILTLVVWTALGTAPAVDLITTFPTFESCEAKRQHYNEIYQADLDAHEIAGYETGCKPYAGK